MTHSKSPNPLAILLAAHPELGARWRAELERLGGSG
jgi:hypothetical protein